MKNKKRIIGLLSFFVSGYFLFSPLVSADPAATKIKIGFVAALSGEDSAIGNDLRDAILFANSYYANNAYDFVIEDDRCNGKNAVSIAQKFINIDKLRFVLGFSCSSATLPVAPLYEKAKVLSIVSAASSPKISDAGDFMFRTTPNDSEAGIVLGNYVGSHFKKVGILSEESDYSSHLSDVFAAAIKKNGAEVVQENFLPNMFDFHALLIRLKEKGIDAIFINTQAEKTFAVALRQLKSLGATPAIFGAYWPGSPVLLQIARSELEGVIFVDAPSLDAVLNDEGHTFMKAYFAQGGTIRGTEAMFITAVESFRALDATIKSGVEPRDFLYHHQFHGIFGDYSFDEKGDIRGLSLGLKIIKDGQPVTFKEK